MKFSTDLIQSPWVVRAYERGSIRVGEETYRHSLLLMPERLKARWHIENMNELTAGEIQALAAHGPDLILFGSGETQCFPPPALLAPLMEARIGHEVMTTAAACRTFNILLSEGRPVLAALIV